MTEFAAARTHMIDCQLRPNEVNDPAVIEAIGAVAREMFVPKAKRSVAYIDEDIEVVPGRYLMEPMIFAKLLVAADIRSNDLVLDVGCATGYSSAVIAGLADAVVALEEDAELAASAEARLAENEVMNAAVMTGALTDGVAKQGPFDVIFIEGAVEELPAKLTKQLKEGGRLVCVKIKNGVGRGHLVIKRDGLIAERDLFDANVPLLPGFSAPRAFEF